MKKTTFLLSALVLLLLGTACKNSGFKKTKSGLLYKIIPNGNGPLLKRGDMVKIQFINKLKDSVLVNSYEQMPFYGRVDSVGPVYDPQEIFLLMRKGDSAVVISEADSMLKKRGGLPDFLKPKDKLVLAFRVVEVFTSDSAFQKDQMESMAKAQQMQLQKMEKMKAPKIKEIEDYLSKNKIQYQKGAQGTYVEIKDPGNGPQVDSGKHAYVKYTGKSFPSMKVFETNMDGSRPPYDVLVGSHSVIPGWEEGLKFFKKGGKGTLYIPFFMGYGPQGPTGQPYETLVFDIEVDDVTDSAKAAAPMPMPPPPPAPKK